MTNFTIVSSFRNKNNVNDLIKRIREKGYSCYNFADTPADPNNPEGEPEEQMKVFESNKGFMNDSRYKEIFDKDLEGLKNAEKVILLLPAGTSAHMEIGIAYGLGKKCILIGEPQKPESLYLLFHECYGNTEDFLKKYNKKIN